MTGPLLPINESFSAPSWSENPTSTNRVWGPWWQQYVNYQPSKDLTSGTASGFPFLSGGALESISTAQLFTPYGASALPGALCTDTSGLSQASQRCFLCREEDAIDNDDNTYIATFALTDAASGQLGGNSTERSGAGRSRFNVAFPVNDATEDVGLPSSSKESGGSAAGLQGGISGTLNAASRGGAGNTGLHVLWNGNSVFFRVGAGDVERVSSSGTLSSTQFALARLNGYAFCAYPSPNASTEKVDLTVELWRLTYASGSESATLLAAQTVAGGASRIKFGEPYYLKADVVNSVSSVDIRCYIGAYSTPHNGEVNEVQCFKDDAFESGTATVTTGVDVTLDTATGIVKHTATDRISTYTGRTFGWSMGRDRVQDVSDRTFDAFQVLVQAVESVCSLEVLNTSSSARLYYDDWSRVVSGISLGGNSGAYSIKTIQDQFGNYGPQRLGRFTLDYDAGYAWDTTDNRQVRRSVWCNDLPLDYTSFGQDYFQFLYGLDLTPSVGSSYTPESMFRTMVDTFGSSQFYNHRRSISFLPPVDNPDGLVTPAASLNQFEIGVWIRGSFNGYEANSGLGAVVYWQTDGDGTMTFWRVAIYERVWSHRNQVIAPASLGRRVASKTYNLADIGSAPDLYNGSYHTLDFRAEIDSTATSPSSPCKYYVEFDGVPINLDDTSADVTSESSSPYPVIDISPLYIGGNQEALSFWSFYPSVMAGGVNYNPAKMKLWSQGAVASDPGNFDVDDDLLESIVIAGEPAPTTYLNAAGGALAFGTSFFEDIETEVSVSHTRTVVGNAFESGHRYSFASDPNERRVYRVAVRAVSKEVIDNLALFFNARGLQETFYFNCDLLRESSLTDEQVPVFFMSDTLKMEMIGPGVYDCEFSLVESIQ